MRGWWWSWVGENVDVLPWLLENKQNQRENSHIYIKPITYHTIQYLNSIPNFPKSTQTTDQNLKTRFLKPNIQNSTLHQNTRDQFQTLISPTEYQKQRIKRKSRRNIAQRRYHCSHRNE
ncbi:hypothetical protein G4B88_029630 [Cannabis sativa]|uniref:Uncharacterized protein n=1 Tax=Cannabis sativa TaxID=3483 RepID=A0A7J6FVC0_CANSA|nr:hypothetical protein G4B88_029630 [Cannabis sativa]